MLGTFSIDSVVLVASDIYPLIVDFDIEFLIAWINDFACCVCTSW